MAKSAVKSVVAQAETVTPMPPTKTKPKVSYRGRKQKGSRFENEIAKAVGGKRVPLSGALAHLSRDLAEDVTLPTGEKVQCKVQHDGFKQLYGWLITADLLAVKADGHTPLMVLPLPLFQDLYAKARNYDSKLLGTEIENNG